MPNLEVTARGFFNSMGMNIVTFGNPLPIQFLKLATVDNQLQIAGSLKRCALHSLPTIILLPNRASDNETNVKSALICLL